MNYREVAPRKSMHGQIVHDLGVAIVSGKLKPSERLPAEAVLSETYKVSRPVLREAIRVLTAKGLVLSKQRLGAVVRPRSEWHVLDPDVLSWIIGTTAEGEFFKSLIVVRRIIEPAAASLAASNRTDEDLQHIRRAVKGMETAESASDFLGPDLEFHKAVFAAAHNDLLAGIGNLLTLALSESIRLTATKPEMHELTVPRHRAILAAIEARDPLGARQASLVQLEGANADADEILGMAGHP